jgi:hypothetical protein
MTRLICCLSLAVVTLSACEPVPGSVINLPENVQELAAPYQDLSTARINPDDGCYEYLHRGVVEDTYLPLRTPQGNPICTPKSAA